jgi:hypothetical protein
MNIFERLRNGKENLKKTFPVPVGGVIGLLHFIQSEKGEGSNRLILGLGVLTFIVVLGLIDADTSDFDGGFQPFTGVFTEPVKEGLVQADEDIVGGLRQLNKKVYPDYQSSGQVIPADQWTSPSGVPHPVTGCTNVTVKQWDTLTKIAAENNSTVDNIVKKNNLKDPNKIYPKQELTVCPE